MYSTKVLLAIAALAGTSLSQKSDSQFCSEEAGSLFSLILADAPTTPAAILSFIATHTELPPVPTTIDPVAHQSQLCALATALPSSLLPEFASLAGGLLDFGRSHSSDFIAYATNCAPADEVASSSSYLSYVFGATGNICTETATATATPTPTGASNGTYPTITPTVSSHVNGSSTSTLIPTAAAARPTGALLGAAAVGGVLGAAAML